MIHKFSAIAIVVISTTIWRAIEKRSHEPNNKSNTKNEVKRLRVTITKLEEQ